MKFSVIVPTFNRAALLRACIESICSVRHRPLELVVVDDGSSDGTATTTPVLEQMCTSQGVEFRFVRQVNAGASAARNTGLAHSTGQLIQWVDADDTVTPSGVDAVVEALVSDDSLDVAYGLVNVVDSEGRSMETMGKAPAGGDADLFDLLWHTMGAIYKRRALDRTGEWNTRLTLGDDWDYSSRIRIAGCRYEYVPVMVGNYVKHNLGSLTTTSYDEKKCFQVIEAVLSIRGALQSTGKLSPYLQQRCFNRVLVHALELSSNRSSLSGEAFRHCRDIGSPSAVLRGFLAIVERVRLAALHEAAYRILRSK